MYCASETQIMKKKKRNWKKEIHFFRQAQFKG